MSGSFGIVVIALTGLCLALVLRRRCVVEQQFDRLSLLWEQSVVISGGSNEEINWARSADALSSLNDRFGKAGFLTRRERTRAKQIIGALLIVPIVTGIILGLRAESPIGLFMGLSVGIYGGAGLALGWLRYRVRDFEREVLFQVPLVLEGLILLVEAGLSILPALEKIVNHETETKSGNPVTRIFRLVYELASHGIPLGQALEMVSEATDLKVLRHVLLHLDITGTEGGELVPVLRSLSEHAHTEWRLSVEYRVKRLENLVVFPVFTAVIGLMLLTAAVPLVPVLKVRDTLSSREVLTPQPSGLEQSPKAELFQE